MKLKIADIVIDAGTQIRVSINESAVVQYAESMKDGDKFPPVDVYNDGNRYILADGFHRLLAAQRNGETSIEAKVQKGTKSDALKFALSANAKHGEKRTNADKRRSVELALAEWPKLSNRELARICAVSEFVVRDARPVNCDNIAVETRIGSDGKERKLPVRPLKKPAEVKAPSRPQKPAETNPEPKEESQEQPQEQDEKPHITQPTKNKRPEGPKDQTGIEVPPECRELWDRGGEIHQKLLIPLFGIRRALEEAQEKNDPLFREVSFSTNIASVNMLVQNLKSAVPHAICPSCNGILFKDCETCKGRGFISKFYWDTCIAQEIKDLRK